VGVIVNGASVFILDHGSKGHQHDHDSRHDQGNHRDHEHDRHHDHNLRSAYLHVLADALTSLLAIVALLAAKHLGLIWMDPAMGVLGALLVSWWSVGLLRASSSVLLDKRGPEALQAAIKAKMESDGDTRVADLHLWSIGPNLYGLILTVVTREPKPARHYKDLLPPDFALAHVTVEVHQCRDGERAAREGRAASGGVAARR
jgi:cation diffusion facilitator family transporter